MQDFAARLRYARKAAGFENASDAARAFGWNVNTYRAHENSNRGVRREVAIAYARAFRVNLRWLMTGAGEPFSGDLDGPLTGVKTVPIIDWSDILELRERPLGVRQLTPRGHVVVPGVVIDEDRTYALQIEDDANKDPAGGPFSLIPGDIVVITNDRRPRPSELVLAIIDDEPVLGRYRVLARHPDGSEDVAVVPQNPDFPPRNIKRGTSDRLMGRMISLIRHT